MPEAMRILSNSAITSGAAPVESLTSAGTSVGKGVDFPQQVRHFAAARGFSSLLAPGSVVVEFSESTHPLRMNLSVLVDISGAFTSMSVINDRIDLAFHVGDRPEFRQTTFSDLLFAEGPPRESWTIPTWKLLSGDPIETGLASLAASVEKIRRGLLPQRPPRQWTLAREAVARMAERRDEELEQWAERLAREISTPDD